VKIHSHKLTCEQKMSSLFKFVLTCSYKDCPWKVIIILLCCLKDGFNDNADMQNDYRGFLIFTGYSGNHRENKTDEFKVMPGYEDIVELPLNHSVPRNNLAGIVKVKKISFHKNPEANQIESQQNNLKYGLKEIPEIKQIVKQYQIEKEIYQPSEVVDYVVKWVK
jgi:hypothetical protein